MMEKFVRRSVRPSGEQYLPRSIEGELPRTIAGQVLSLADRLDTSGGVLPCRDLVPTGSEDPFALAQECDGHRPDYS